MILRFPEHYFNLSAFVFPALENSTLINTSNMNFLISLCILKFYLFVKFEIVLLNLTDIYLLALMQHCKNL